MALFFGRFFEALKKDIPAPILQFFRALMSARVRTCQGVVDWIMTGSLWHRETESMRECVTLPFGRLALWGDAR